MYRIASLYTYSNIYKKMKNKAEETALKRHFNKQVVCNKKSCRIIFYTSTTIQKRKVEFIPCKAWLKNGWFFFFGLCFERFVCVSLPSLLELPLSFKLKTHQSVWNEFWVFPFFTKTKDKWVHWSPIHYQWDFWLVLGFSDLDFLVRARFDPNTYLDHYL